MTIKDTVNHAGEMMPDELGALKKLVEEFVGKLESIDNEISLLKEDRKSLCEEYSSQLDMKTLNAALRIVKIKSGIAHRDAFDAFLEVLDSHD